MYKIRDAGVKGLGVFATKSIPRGTRLLAERPLLSVKSERDVYAESKKLRDEDRDWLMRLSIDTHKKPTLVDWANSSWNLIRSGTFPTSSIIAEHDTISAVFKNNNFHIGEGTQSVFKNICRINHSCVPNSQGNFNSAIGSFTIHAIRGIEPEEEVTISYLDEHGATTDSRQRRLWEGYGFECTCPICEPGSTLAQRSDERRTKVLYQVRQNAERIQLKDEPDYKGQLEIIKELIAVCEEDGLAGRELSTMYIAAAEGHSRLGEEPEAQRCAKAGLQIEEDALGKDNPLYQESVKRVAPIVGQQYLRAR